MKIPILAPRLMILASAGSGKTYQLGNRVIGMIAQGTEPKSMVALTFTRKAAGEFADSVLTKLAEASMDSAKSASLAEQVGVSGVDFTEVLERVVSALPGFTLGTMDSFFSSIVRAFQYEFGLCGGRFDLLEGARQTAMTDRMLEVILRGNLLAESASTEFFHAFRRATMGREGNAVVEDMRRFVKIWHARYQDSPDAMDRVPRGPAAREEDWEAQKHGLLDRVNRELDGMQWTDKRQLPAMQKALDLFAQHRIGSGVLPGSNKLLEQILELAESASDGGHEIILKFYKEFIIHESLAEALRDCVSLVAECEFAAAVARTQALQQVVRLYDQLCEKHLRDIGMLQFDDVKRLMGRWQNGEDERLTREAIDFRLSACYEHWLLDEFQDTSRADWAGLRTLIDEAQSLFIVGDRKQAIYGWRGGDVRLFDEVREHYQKGMEIAPMDESWRSCPEVLELVNQVCGDARTMAYLFGDVAQRWSSDWIDHVSAKPLCEPAARGEARVEEHIDAEARMARMVEILDHLGIGRVNLTCGVLVRDNKGVREVADFLRAHGFDVIEDGRRKPAEDNPLGITLHQLLRWLANPTDGYALEVLKMSKLGKILLEIGGGTWPKVWEWLTHEVSSRGYRASIQRLIDRLWDGLTAFGQRRADDLLGALAEIDARKVISPSEAADWLARVEIAQSPGIAAVQVMTIHKSKGLGFDVVVLPEIPDTAIPHSQYFEVAEGDGWLLSTPPKWVRALIPELRDAEEAWADKQRYEAFCMLYVALTRAKRGLYVLLDQAAPSSDGDKASLANWLRSSLLSSRDPQADAGELFHAGSADWAAGISSAPAESNLVELPSLPNLGPAVPMRQRQSPSSAKSSRDRMPSLSGMRFGSAVHELLERVSWIDENPPLLPDHEAGRVAGKLLKNPELAAVFRRDGRDIILYREQPVSCLSNDKILHGIMDRLHLHRDAGGAVRRVEIIDYKTDLVSSSDELISRYQNQMMSYRDAVAMIYPSADIECSLVSTHLNALVLCC